MAIHIQAKTILANLLFERDTTDGIDMADINNFIDKIKSKMDSDCLRFHTDDRDISDALSLYDNIFKKYQNTAGNGLKSKGCSMVKNTKNGKNTPNPKRDFF